MKPARFRLAYAMLIVLVAALDLALIRASGVITGGTPDDVRMQMIVLFVLPMANLLAVALAMFALRPGSGRRFWGGFAASAAITSALSLAGVTLLDRATIERPMARLVGSVMFSLTGKTNMFNTTEILAVFVVVLSIFSLPQVVLALLCGFLSRAHRTSRTARSGSTPERGSEQVKDSQM